MKNFLFVLGHLGSNNDLFCKSLNQDSRVHFFKTNFVYSHPFDLDNLKNNKHKLNNSAAIWADNIVFNHNLTSKSLYPFCKFIFFVDNPHNVLCELIKHTKDIEYVINYYSFRLRRMVEIAQEVKGIFIFSEEIDKKINIIKSYLNLKDQLNFDFKFKKNNQLVSYNDLIRLEKIFEKYYSRLNKLSM